MVDLKGVSDADLFGEVARRREADLQERIEVGKVMAQRIVKNIDALLELVPRHTKQSCADNLPLFVHDGCTRCQLVEIKRTGVSGFEIDTIKLKLLYKDGSALVVGPFKPEPKCKTCSDKGYVPVVGVTNPVLGQGINPCPDCRLKGDVS